MLRRIRTAVFVATALSAGAASAGDCFNDDDQSTGRRNDVEPPAALRTPEVLRVTDADVAGLLAAIAAHERRRQAASADNGTHGETAAARPGS
jgi:hypothetical protein